MPSLICIENTQLRAFNLEANAWEEHSVQDMLKDAIAFNPRLKCDFDALAELERTLFTQIWGERRINKVNAKRRTLRRVISNLYYAYVNRVAVTVSMSKRTYARHGRRCENVDSYQDMASIFGFLERTGAVARKKGNTFSGKASRYWVALNNPFEKTFRVWRNLNLASFKFEVLEELIVVRDTNKRKIETPRDNRFVKEEEFRLARYNQLLLATTLGLTTDRSHYPTYSPHSDDYVWQQLNDSILIMKSNGEPVYITRLSPPYMRSISNFLESRETLPPKKLRMILRLIEKMSFPGRNQLQRIFNRSSFDYGGRFYGTPVHSFPKALRALLTINGKPTVEHDYACFHVSILYHLKSLDPPADPYLFPDGHPLRNIAKLIVNTAINANNRLSALRSVTQQLREASVDDALRAFSQSEYLRSYLGWSKVKVLLRSIAALYDALKQYHSAVGEHLGTGDGLKLQRIDSDIASDIFWHFTQQGICVIPVHDSFIIQAEHSTELKTVMADLYFKRFGKPIRIK